MDSLLSSILDLFKSSGRSGMAGAAPQGYLPADAGHEHRDWKRKPGCPKTDRVLV